MKKLILAIALLLPVAAQANPVTLGGVLAVPEIFGLQAAYYVDPLVDLDLRLTLATADAGVTGHLPVGHLGPYRSDLLLNLMGGYVHSGVHTDMLPYRSARVLAAVGWGVVGLLDIRVLGGISAAQYDAADNGSGWGVRFAGYILVGYVF